MSVTPPNSRLATGFTLLELIIVVAILATLAGGVVLMVGQTEEITQGQIGLVEMSEIREAIVQFKRDTGYLPKQGPFDLTTNGGAVPPPVEGEDWFNSPANFSQLFQNPLANTGHSLASWNPDTKRGWRGPYLTTSGEGRVDVGSNLNLDGSGDPQAGSLLNDVFGIADPFYSSPKGSYFVWATNPTAPPYSRFGRPYFVFDLHDPQKARIVGMGPNRQYDQGAQDDIIVYLFR